MPFIAAPNQAPNSVGIFHLPGNRTGLGGAGGGGGGGGGALVNITMGNDGLEYGFRGTSPFGAPFGTPDNTNPVPPNLGNGTLAQVSQNSSGRWLITMQPAIISQFAWNIITLTTPALSDVAFSSAASVYQANNSGHSVWVFVTAVRWFGLANGTPVTATFS